MKMMASEKRTLHLRAMLTLFVIGLLTVFMSGYGLTDVSPAAGDGQEEGRGEPGLPTDDDGEDIRAAVPDPDPAGQDPCLRDVCDPLDGIYEPQGTPCDDGIPNNGVDTCSTNGVCSAGGQIAQIPTTHPIVWLSDAAEVSRLQANLSTSDGTLFKNKIDAMVANPSSDVWYVQWPWHAALMYVLTGDTTYATAAIAEMDPQVAAKEAAGFPQADGGDLLEVPYHYLNVALVYDWCYDQLMPAQRSAWVTHLENMIDRIWAGASDFWPDDAAMNNYWTGYLESTMLAACVLNDGNSTRNVEFQTLFRTNKWEGVLVPQWTPPRHTGGGDTEGNYYGYFHSRVFRIIDWWLHTAAEDLAPTLSLNTIEDHLQYWLHSSDPAFTHKAQQGDQARESTGLWYDFDRINIQHIISLLPTNNTTARHAVDFLAQVPQFATWDTSRNYFWGFAFGPSGYGYTPLSITGKTDLYLHTPVQGAGKTFIRSSWDPADNPVMVHYTHRFHEELGQWDGPSAHSHSDVSAFNIFANGEWIARDANWWSSSGLAGNYYWPDIPQEPHNLVRLVGDVELSMPYTGSLPQIEFAEDNTGAAVPHYYHQFEVSNIWPTASLHRRQIIYIPKNILVVYDRVNSTSDQVWQLNSPANPSILGSEATFTTASNTMKVRTLLPSLPNYSVHDWAASGGGEDSFNGGFRLDISQSAGDREYINVIDLDGTVSWASVQTSATQHTVTIDLTASGSHTLVFHKDGSHTLVFEGDGVLNITTTSLPDGIVGSPYSEALSARGGSTPYSWSIQQGVLPGGLELASDMGVISGTPTTEGTYDFTVQVTDAEADTDTQDLSITVRGAVQVNVKKGLIFDKKNVSNNDRLTLILTHCTGLADAVSDLSMQSVCISVGPDGQEPFYQTTIPGASFVSKADGKKYRYKVNAPEKHRDQLLPNKEQIKMKVGKAELDAIADPNAVNPISIRVQVGEYLYESVATWRVKDKTRKTTYKLKE